MKTPTSLSSATFGTQCGATADFAIHLHLLVILGGASVTSNPVRLDSDKAAPGGLLDG